MCEILLVNTIPTNYRHFFDWFEQTYAYWAIYREVSERHSGLQFYWD